MKARNIIFTLIFVLSISSVGIYHLLIKTPLEVSVNENRNLKQFEAFDLDKFFNRKFQNNLEDAFLDQFEGRIDFLHYKNKFEYLSNKTLISLLGTTDIEALNYQLIKIGDTNVAQVGLDSDYLMNYPMHYKEEFEKRFISRFEQINAFANKHPEVQVYVYKPTQIHEVNWFDEVNIIDSYGVQYGELFKEYLKVPYKSYNLIDLDDYKKKFYSSDHHWNHLGSYQGYEDIISMLIENPTYIEPTKLDCFDNLGFFGTFAGRTGYITKPSEFCAYDFDYPEHTVKVDGKLVTKFGIDDYLNGNYKNDSYTYHYDLAFGPDGGIIEMDYNQPDKENVLFIRDSYAKPIMQQLASHFNKSYFVDPRVLRNRDGIIFNYEEFLKEHNIDKVVFMYTIEYYFLEPEYVHFDIK